MNLKKVLVSSSHLILALMLTSSFSSQTVVAQEPVENQPTETEYEPSFPEQTRAPLQETETSYEVNIITESLQAPWGMAELPDGRLLITQKEGSFVIVDLETQSVNEAIGEIPNVNPAGQGGLLGVEVSPDFAENREIYFVFSEDVEDGNHTSVAKANLAEDEASLENFTVIFRATPAYAGEQHFGGRLIFDPDGNLFVTTGERSDAPIREQAQDLSSYLGKIVHITTDGEAVNAEGYFDEDSVADIYTYGHRNVQGIDFHPETGELWISEMGPRGGDELNLLEAGQNYGWPVVSYGIEYSGAVVNDGETSAEEFTEPVYYWDPVIAPSGMTFYDNNQIPEWENNLLIGALAGSHIARVIIEDQQVVGEDRLLADEGQRFRDILASSDGAVYAITDQGRLYQIQASAE